MQLNTLIGKKTFQKQGFLEDGSRVPLTAIMVSGNVITQIKTDDKEGYSSIQLGINAKKKTNNAILGHVKKALDQSPKTPDAKKILPKYFKEVRVDDTADFNLGTEIVVAEVFAAGDLVDVTGVSKGKGWAGGVKRYHFRGGPRTHGQSDRERAPGSIGQTTTPGRVYKGKKMAGRMGADTVTVKNLQIVEVTNDGVILVKGLVPGRVNNLLMVKRVGENKKFKPLYKEAVEEPIAQEEIIKAEEEASVETSAAESQETLQEVKEEANVQMEEPIVKEELVVDNTVKDEVVREDK